jgi:hypothetical protein
VEAAPQQAAVGNTAGHRQASKQAGSGGQQIRRSRQARRAQQHAGRWDWEQGEPGSRRGGGSCGVVALGARSGGYNVRRDRLSGSQARSLTI